MPANASNTNAHITSVTADRAMASGWVPPPKVNSNSRDATWDGPNSAPIATTVPASMPARPKIASRCADMPDGTKE